MKIDYKLVDSPRKRRHPSRWLVAALLVGTPALVAVALVNDQAAPSSLTVTDSRVIEALPTLPPVQIRIVDAGDNSPEGVAVSESVAAVDDATPAPEYAPERATTDIVSEQVAETVPPEILPSPEPANWDVVKVASGDNLTRIFGRFGLNGRDVYDVLALGGPVDALKKIHPGEELRLQVTDGRLVALQYAMDEFHELRITREQDDLQAHVETFKKEVRVTRATGVIEDSLYLAGNRAGMSDKLIMKLVEIFGWDINFWLDIREGDRFAVIFEEIYRDGEKIDDGQILAAEFVNQNEVHRAIYYADDKVHAGYYDPQGRPMRKTFLRSPIKDAPITSGFTLRRFHPILKTWRAHRGVDYGARAGTPIRATGDGTITRIGWSDSYGKVVTIQHAGRYSTLYAHMSRFAPKLKKGERVRQGQVIGYVGQTGLARGAHLHFEFRVDGVHRDPQRVHFPQPEPLPKQQLTAFNDASKALISELDNLSGQMVAMHQTE